MNLEKLLARRFPVLEHRVTPRDCMLYALGIGASMDPLEAGDLQFTYEGALHVFPSMVNVICHPGGWIKDPELGIDWVKLLHGEQRYTIHRPLDPSGTYVGSYRVTDVVDKGRGKPAMLFAENELRDKQTGEVVAAVASNYVCRGDGGSGGTRTELPQPHALPERSPDETCVLRTLPQSALVYRLSGDYNPIHADPALARSLSGFRSADSARTMHARHREPRARARHLRTQCGAASFRSSAVLGSSVSGRNHRHRDVARRRCREFPLARG